MVREQLKRLDAVVIVYAVDDKRTFANVRLWQNEVRQVRGDMHLLLVGNKIDVPVEQRQVTVGEGEDLAKEFGCKHATMDGRVAVQVEKCLSAFCGDVLRSRGLEPILPEYMKLLMIGPSSSDKSKWLRAYHSGYVANEYSIGVDFVIKKIECHGRECMLQIWDTAGQERYSTITRSYFRGALGVFLVFDLTCMSSFSEAMGVHMDNILRHFEGVVVLVGTHAELTHARAVGQERAMAEASARNMRYFEVSFHDMDSMKAPFYEMANLILAQGSIGAGSAQ